VVNVTVQACLDNWLTGKPDIDQRIAAMRTKLVALSDQDTSVAIDAAIKGLSPIQQHQAYEAVMSAIIAKAGGADPDAGIHSVVGDAVALIDGEALTPEYDEHFKQAARALDYGHYLRAMELAVPGVKSKIRQQMACHIDYPWVSADVSSCVLGKLNQVDDTPTSHKEAAQAILHAFDYAGAVEAADELVGHIKRTLGDIDAADAMRTALHSVWDKAKHCCINAADAKALLTNAASFEADGHLGSLLKSQRDNMYAKVEQIYRKQPIQHENSSQVSSAADALVRMVTWREIAEQTLKAHHWAVAQFGSDHQNLALLAGQMMAVGVPPVVMRKDQHVNQAVLLSTARQAAKAQQLPLKALQEAVIAAGVALDTDVTKLTDAQLNLICTKITHELSDDNTARAFINAFALAHSVQSPFTVSDLLMVTSIPIDALATRLPSLKDDAARSRQARALAAVITAMDDNNKVGLHQMAALEQRVAQLIQVTSEMADGLYHTFESNLYATVDVRDVVGVLENAPDSDALQRAAGEGRALRNTAALDPASDSADAAVLSALVIDAMLRAADTASSSTEAIQAMFRTLYAHDAASRGKTVTLENAGAFAERYVKYLNGKLRKAYWLPGNELCEPFDGLLHDMLTVTTRGSDYDDTEHLAAIKEILGYPAARLQAVHGVNGWRQIILRRKLLMLQAKFPSTKPDTVNILERYLLHLCDMNVLRPEDINAMCEQCLASATLVEAKGFIQSIIDNGWDFIKARPATSGLGLVNTDAVFPVTITSLRGKAEQAADTIRLAIGVTARISVIQAPVLKRVMQDNAVLQAGALVEDSVGDAVIQVGKSEPGLPTGKVTMREEGGVVTHDHTMVVPMIHAVMARYPGGGNFTPTYALMTSKHFLQKALQSLAKMSKNKGIQYTIFVSQTGYNNLAEIQCSLSKSGITVVNTEAQNTNNSPKQSQATPTSPTPDQMSQHKNEYSPTSLPFASRITSDGPSPDRNPGHMPS